jgi:putative transposase
VRPGVGHLRTQSRLGFIRKELQDASERFGMQLVHFSIQGSHLHLIVEADGREALSKSMKGLAVRLAVGLNRLAGRSGPVFADRYHARALGTPREVANTIRYVIDNHRKHTREALPREWQDPFASSIAEPLRPPKVWLLRVGWRRARPLMSKL